MARRQHKVRFLSPGTFVSEESVRVIDAWDVAVAVKMANEITERHGAKPYGFRFETYIVADPVDDGEGGTLEVLPKRVELSGTYFLGGDVLSIDQIEARNDSAERILLNNMRCNNWPYVVDNCNSYRSVHPFEESDVVVDLMGVTIIKGNDPVRVEYRRRKIAERRAELERLSSEWENSKPKE